MQDYGMSLKMDDFDTTLRLNGDILSIFYLLGQAEYSKCTLLNLIMLKHHKRNNTPIWQAVKRASSLLNEEGGEMYLGIFARQMARCPKKLDHRLASPFFTVVPKLWESARALGGDVEVDAHLSRKRRKNCFAADCKEVKDTQTHIMDTFQEYAAQLENDEVGQICLKCEAEEEGKQKKFLGRVREKFQFDKRTLRKIHAKTKAILLERLEGCHFAANICLPDWPYNDAEVEDMADTSSDDSVFDYKREEHFEVRMYAVLPNYFS